MAPANKLSRAVKIQATRPSIRGILIFLMMAVVYLLYLQLIELLQNDTFKSEYLPKLVYQPMAEVLEQSISIKVNDSSRLCPRVPPALLGPRPVQHEPPSMENLTKSLPDVEAGRWHPPDCTSRTKVAIIVPFRDRAKHLNVFLAHLHPMLQRQQIDYGIFVIEQLQGGLFNRAKLFNVGYLEASKIDAYACYIFHDVDLIPEDDRNLYTCPRQPRHMSVAIDKFNYRLQYACGFGGVSALTREQFEDVNGFSNDFWGWGGEDDDMYRRLYENGYNIERYANEIARYTMLKHQHQALGEDPVKTLAKAKRRHHVDGLSSIRYKMVEFRANKLYTWILADID